MKSKEEIRIKWIRHTPLLSLDECVDKAMQEYAMQFQEDLVKGLQSLIDVYKSDILKLEEEFKDSSSVLTLEKIVTLQGVVNNLEAKFYIKY